MDEQELKEMMGLLEAAGVRARLCDTPVRVSGSSVVCGVPAEPGDDDWSDYWLLPKSLVGMHPEMLIPAEGDSMADAGYEAGDLLRVRFGVAVHDGDSVLAWIDGRCTVKAFFTDEDGERWLVPRNENYDAILLTEEMDVRLLGVVVGVEKAATRTPSRPLLQAIRRTKNKRRAARRLPAEAVDALVVRIGPLVVHARQWFAVYRALLDVGLTEEGDFEGFALRVKQLLPAHVHLPEAKELRRMDVQSFAKPVVLWEESNAPVRGQRFRDYLRIALTMGDLLAGK